MSVRARPRTLVTALLAVTMALVAAIVTSQPASAHGSVTDPPDAQLRLLGAVGQQPPRPDHGAEGPHVLAGLEGRPERHVELERALPRGRRRQPPGASIPNGQLCSGGRTQAPRYNALDAVGAWVAKGVPTSFTLTLTDSAKHGADYLRIYVTKAGFDPTTEAIGWDDLDLVKETGRYGTTGLYQTDVEPVRPQRPGGPVHDLAGQPPGPAVLPVQRHQHRWRQHDADPHPDADGDLHADADPDPTVTPTPTPTPTVTPTPTPADADRWHRFLHGDGQGGQRLERRVRR